MAAGQRSEVILPVHLCAVTSRLTGSGHHGGRGGMRLGELHQSSVGDEDQEGPEGGRGAHEEEDQVRGHWQVRLRLLRLVCIVLCGSRQLRLECTAVTARYKLCCCTGPVLTKGALE